MGSHMESRGGGQGQRRLRQLGALDLQGGRVLGTHEELDPGTVKMTRRAWSKECIFYKIDHACCARKVNRCRTELKEGNNPVMKFKCEICPYSGWVMEITRNNVFTR